MQKQITTDALWKILIRDFFKEALEFFAPEIVKQIDFSKEYQFLDKELGAITKERKHVDNLVKVYFKDNSEQWLLIHIEVQSYKDANFAQRMFDYYSLIYLTYKKPIYPIAIFTTDEKNIPNEYVRELADTKIILKYKTYAIAEQDEKNLEKNNNIFALVVLASIYTLKAKNDNMRADFIKELTRLLAEKKIEKNRRIRLFHFLYIILKIENEQYKSELRKELLGMGGKEDMDITWDDVVLNSPITEWFMEDLKEETKKEEEKKGKEKILKIAQKLLKQGMTIEEISKITELPVNELKKLPHFS